MNHPRGSLFRKWDLHVHTPASVLEQQFGSDWDDYATRLIRAALTNDVAVIGVTDYFSIAGFKRLKTDYLDDPEKLRQLLGDDDAARAASLLFLPCVEFRVPPIIDHGEKVDLHVIFSPEVSIGDIEQNFLHQLSFRYSSEPQTTDERHPLTTENLTRLGRRLKREHAQFHGTDLYVGVMNALVDDESISKELTQKPALFRGKYLLGVAADETLSRINFDSGAHQVRKTLIQKSDFLLSANPGTIEFGRGWRHPSPRHFVEEFRSLKPCLWGSDAHDYDRLFRPAEDRHLWIKADTTFEGLRQAIRETRRVFIGSEPEELASAKGARRSRLIDRVRIRNTSPLPNNETWFSDVEVLLNPGLVVIIGNRGSGKSALADTIGLAGGSQNSEHFSFLSPDTFRRQPENKARHFEAQLYWADGNPSPPCVLAEDPEPGTPMRVQYIPQLFLERLCATPDQNPFEHELDRVMFDLIPDEDREGSSSIADLLAARSRAQQSALPRLQESLRGVNAEIRDLELALSKVGRTDLEQRRDLVRQRIAAHYRDTPTAQDPGFHRSTEIGRRLATLQAEKEQVDSTLVGLRERSASLGKQITQLNSFLSDLDRLTSEYEGVKDTHSQALRSLQLKFEDIVKLEIDREAVNTKLGELSATRETVSGRLSEEVDGSEAQKAAELQREIERLGKALQGPDRIVEQNRSRTRAWREELRQLIGTGDEAESLEGLNRQLREQRRLLPGRLSRRRRQRREIAAAIHGQKRAIVEAHDSVYQPVIDRTDNAEILVAAQLSIGVRSHLRPQRASAELLSYIDRSARGHFQGIPESEVAMSQLVDLTQWDSTSSVCEFLDEVIRRLEERDPEDPSCIAHQMRLDKHLAFYDYLYGLDYLHPTSELALHLFVWVVGADSPCRGSRPAGCAERRQPISSPA